MTVEVKVPVLAESVAEANLLQWHKKVGDPVKRGENLIDIETDKVTLEVASPTNGILTEILKQDGEDVESDELIARIESEKKSTVETPATKSTEEKPEVNKPDEDAPQQQTLLDAEPELKSELVTEPEIEPVPEPIQQVISKPVEETPKLSPAVRQLLSEKKLKTSDIKTHKHPDRITKEDILNHLGTALSKDASVQPVPDAKAPAQVDVVPENVASEDIQTENQSQRTQATPIQVTPTTNNAGESRPQENVPMTRLRKRTAERLLAAQHENALLTTFNEVNMQPVMDLRHRYQEEFQKTHEVKLGFMSFFTRAAAEALKKFPVINASIDGEDILYRGYFDIGIAVSSPRGLVVPIVRDADTLSVAAIELEISKFGQ